MFFLAATSIIKQVFLFPLWIDLGKIFYIHINILFSKLTLYVCSFVYLLRFHSYNATLILLKFGMVIPTLIFGEGYGPVIANIRAGEPLPKASFYL